MTIKQVIRFLFNRKFKILVLILILAALRIIVVLPSFWVNPDLNFAESDLSEIDNEVTFKVN